MIGPGRPNQTVHNARLEKLAAHTSNYWIGFVTDPAAVLFMLSWDAFILRTQPAVLFSAYVTALISWTFFEYIFHRWGYHRGETLAHAGHQMHHDSPKKLIGMPWFLTTGFLMGFWYLFGDRLRIPGSLSFMAGFATGFIAYGTLHHIHHHFNLRNSWYKRLYAHHQIHHRFPTVNFGVTTRAWDRVFGTVYRKQAMAIDRGVEKRRASYNVIARLASAAQTLWQRT